MKESGFMVRGESSRESIVVTWPVGVRMTMNPPPPMPQENGSTTPSTPAAATAASTGLPPCRRVSMAAWVPRASTVAAPPSRPTAVGCLSGWPCCASATCGSKRKTATAAMRRKRVTIASALPGGGPIHAAGGVPHKTADIPPQRMEPPRTPRSVGRADGVRVPPTASSRGPTSSPGASGRRGSNQRSGVMRSPLFRLIVFAAMATLLVLPAGAASKRSEPPDAVSTYTWTDNLEPKGHSARNVPLENASPVDGIYNSDLAFWGKRAFQGTYEGFRIIDIRSSSRPREIINYAECSPGTTQGNQGDVIVWDDILVRSWNSPALPTSSCDGHLVGAGFEGLHIFDISNPRNPELVGQVDLDGLPNLVTVNAPSTAVGQYQASGAAFGPAPTAGGFSGNVIAVNDGVAGART